jgi:hypothetical protein
LYGCAIIALSLKKGLKMAIIIDDQPTTEVREVRAERHERSITGVVVGIIALLLLLLLLMFGGGLFRGSNSTAPASSGPGPTNTNTSLPTGNSPTGK